jgi:hypothetical protein
MKKIVIQEFISKHTNVIEKVRWVSNAKDKTLTANVIADTKNMVVDLTLNNWDGFGDAEIGIGSLSKFKKELSGIVDDEVNCVLNYSDNKSRIISVDVMDAVTVATIVTSDLDMIGAPSKLKSSPKINAEIIFDADIKERFMKAQSALPDVSTFTVMMNKKGVLELVVGYSNINSSRYVLKVKTNDGKDKVENPLHFRSDYLKEILNANSKCEDTVLKISDSGFCSISFKDGDFDAKYYLTSTDDQD